MLIDLSHCGEKTCLDTIEHSSKPVSITHANPTEFVDRDDWASYRNTRNKSSAVLKELAAAGGVVGFTTYTRLLPDREATTLDRFCEMVEWTVDLMGIEHVAFGSDYGTGTTTSIVRGCVRASRAAMLSSTGSPSRPTIRHGPVHTACGRLPMPSCAAAGRPTM